MRMRRNLADFTGRISANGNTNAPQKRIGHNNEYTSRKEDWSLLAIGSFASPAVVAGITVQAEEEGAVRSCRISVKSPESW